MWKGAVSENGRLIMEVYKICVRSALGCGAEKWAMKVENISRLETIKMRMPQMICGRTLKDKIKNEQIQEINGVKSTTLFMRSQPLRWYEKVERLTEALNHSKNNS